MTSSNSSKPSRRISRSTGDSLALLQGAQAVLAKVNGALRSRGFYDAMATATIDNQPVDEAAALDAIDAHPGRRADSLSRSPSTPARASRSAASPSSGPAAPVRCRRST